MLLLMLDVPWPFSCVEPVWQEVMGNHPNLALSRKTEMLQYSHFIVTLQAHFPFPFHTYLHVCSQKLFLSACSSLSISISCVNARAVLSVGVLFAPMLYAKSGPASISTASGSTSKQDLLFFCMQIETGPPHRI